MNDCCTACILTMKTIFLDVNYVLFDKQTLLSYRHHHGTSFKEVFHQKVESLHDKCIRCVALFSPKSLRRSRSVCSGTSSDGLRAALMGPFHKNNGRSKYAGPDLPMERKDSIKGMTRLVKILK